MIKLNRQLLKRPSAEQLVELGVLPQECFRKGGGMLAPALVETKRRVEREKVKDILRGWVGEWKVRAASMGVEVEEKTDVRRIARRFVAREREREGREAPRWGAGRKADTRESPARANVLGLRRFWEKVGRDGSVV
jgi:hypothetical protein